MKTLQWLMALACGSSVLAAGCRERPEPVYRVTFEAKVDGREPVAGTAVSSNGRLLGRTKDDGTLAVELSGREGERVEVSARCPEGYRTVRAPEAVRLQRFDGLAEGSALKHSIECRPTERQVVVVVLTGAGGELPIFIDGEAQGATDTEGVAHVLVERPPGSTLAVRVDTGARPELAPESPTRLFDVADRDELLVFAPPLTEAKTKPRRRRAAAPAAAARHVPYRID